MEKITDERLVLKNLKTIRIAYLVQTIGILGILGYDFITKGFDGMRENPLWIVFILTSVVAAYLSMNISVDHENEKINPRKSLIISLIVLAVIAATIGLSVSLTEGFDVISGIISGGVLFICGLIPLVYIYYLRTKRQKDDFEN
ncbi:hypothetical protein [Oceanobacillus sp. CAU 1775]